MCAVSYRSMQFYFPNMILAFHIFIITSYTLSSFHSAIEGLPLCGTKKAKFRDTYLNCTIRKWEKVVPYSLANDLSDKLRYSIEDAIHTWNQIFKSCIEFNPRKSEKNFVAFHGGLECYSSLGKLFGEQIIMLDSKTCSTFSKIVHEMMHVVGFQHEHARPDRDNYIKIKFENIPPDWQKQYRIIKENFHFGVLGPYDYQSVMHYGVLGPDNRTRAFEVLQEGIDELDIGNNQNLTDIDVMKVRKLYCPDS